MARWLERPVLQGRVNFPVCLAPMVGLSHVALRQTVRRYLPAGARTIWPTEMLNSWRLPNEEVGQTAETRRAADEDGLVPQILGNEETAIRQASEKLRAWGAEGIDINMGCPVRKALRHNYGVALMGDQAYAAEVVAMAVRSSSLPVSVKLRAGLQNNIGYLLDFVSGLESAGASWLCLHPRLAADKRRGRADWAQIGVVRDRLRVAVVGNGDVQTVADIHAMHEATGCDMVMVGRALTARPWMMWQFAEDVGLPGPLGREGESAPRTPEEEGREFGRALLGFAKDLESFFAESEALKRLNFHLRNAHPWLEFGHALCASVSRARSMAEAGERIRHFFAQPQAMNPRTDLRY